MNGKFYYHDVMYIADHDLNKPMTRTDEFRDSKNRIVKYDDNDFDRKKFFKTSFNGSFYLYVNMKRIKGMLFHPCPWNDTYKDQVLLLYFDTKNFQDDLGKPRRNQWLYEASIHGYDVFKFLEEFKNVNEEMYSEIALIVEMTKDNGRCR